MTDWKKIPWDIKLKPRLESKAQKQGLIRKAQQATAIPLALAMQIATTIIKTSHAQTVTGSVTRVRIAAQLKRSVTKTSTKQQQKRVGKSHHSSRRVFLFYQR
tara:strand:+ start:116 stop:424 length:309 start_codon:yes stop_codon:yes gene_type:complete